VTSMGLTLPRICALRAANALGHRMANRKPFFAGKSAAFRPCRAPAYMRFYSLFTHSAAPSFVVTTNPLHTSFTYRESLMPALNSTEVTPSVRRPLTPWELPKLLTPMHRYRQGKKHCAKERSHYPAILSFVYRNRFAIANQIQHRFSEILKSDRTTRRHLEELESLGFLATAPARGVSPLFPKVYYVTGRGVRKIQESLERKGKPWKHSRIDRRSRDAGEGYAAEHIVHEILITEFLLSLWQTVQARPDLELLTVQRRSLVKHLAFRVIIGNRKTRLIPDAMFLFRQQGGGMCCCFLELDNGTMNQKQLRVKFARYAAWAESATGKQFLIDLYQRHGANEPRPMFRILVVVRSRSGTSDDDRRNELLAGTTDLSDNMRNRLWLMTASDFSGRSNDQFPFEATFWLRASEVKSHRLRT